MQVLHADLGRGRNSYSFDNGAYGQDADLRRAIEASKQQNQMDEERRRQLQEYYSH